MNEIIMMVVMAITAIVLGFGKDGKGAILRESQTVDTTTLAANTVVKFSSQLALTDHFRIIKTEYFIIMRIGSGSPGEHAMVGLADNELSVAEIAETLEVDGPVHSADNLKAERAMRPVWLFEGFVHTSANEGTHLMSNRGAPSEKVLRWTFAEDHGWTWFVWNPLGSAYADGPTYTVIAKHYGVWVR